MKRSNVSDDVHSSDLKEVLFKVLVIGDFGVGKTAIVRRYTQGRFSSNYKITIGADFAIKNIKWGRDTQVNLQLWDIAGHERFGYMTRVYYKYAVAAVIVFDVTRIATFQSVERWLSDLRSKVTLPNDESIPVILLANKSDIDSTVPTEEINRMCKVLNIDAWYLTSAKDDKNIDDAFNFLISLALKTGELESVDSMIDSIMLSESVESVEKKSCCG